jgi:formate dehydrogenase iron-sulfur subunit
MPAVDPLTTSSTPDLLSELLSQQQHTAVERFAHWHAQSPDATPQSRYRAALPLSEPRPGEQYAFEVDLDRCSGCKACVSACHHLNGLDEDETWRTVGLLVGGTSELPVLQHVTTACHHCLEPGCLQGCPVNAYLKDPHTGIVVHLDDQCIGCQYCIFMCPYDVPQYNRRRGIVRKCDMCQQRLAVGEAPACVQACPHQAIRITVVSQQCVQDEAESNAFLPGTADPEQTLPTTVYKSRRAVPRNVLPADYYRVVPQHAHWPLVLMLVLTQMSVGAFAVEQALCWLEASGACVVQPARPLYAAAALVLGLTGLGASVLHLGRPHLAFRAVLGLRRSWLSREIVAFAIFASLAFVYAALSVQWHMPLGQTSGALRVLGAAVVVAGAAGVLCSAMVYARTRRAYWSFPRTATRFVLCSLVLGLPAGLGITLAAAAWTAGSPGIAEAMHGWGRPLCAVLMLATLAKLAWEAAMLRHVRRRAHTPLKRTALLLRGELGLVTGGRFFLGLAGGVLLPGVLLLASQRPEGPHALFAGLIVVLMLLVLAVAELLERYLFFTAVVAPKMPGVPAA